MRTYITAAIPHGVLRARIRPRWNWMNGWTDCDQPSTILQKTKTKEKKADAELRIPFPREYRVIRQRPISKFRPIKRRVRFAPISFFTSRPSRPPITTIQKEIKRKKKRKAAGYTKKQPAISRIKTQKPPRRGFPPKWSGNPRTSNFRRRRNKNIYSRCWIYKPTEQRDQHKDTYISKKKKMPGK